MRGVAEDRGATEAHRTAEGFFVPEFAVGGTVVHKLVMALRMEQSLML